jgi:hypothetical protein
MSVGASSDEIIQKQSEYFGDLPDEFGKMGDNYGLRFFFDKSKWWEYFTTGNGDSIYHHDKFGKPYSTDGRFEDFDAALIDTAEYIPISQSSNSMKSTSNELNTLAGRETTSSTFISNKLSNDPDVAYLDEIETFIKIIDNEDYKTTLDYDSYINDNSTKTTKSLSNTDLVSKKNDLLGGSYKTHEFNSYLHKSLEDKNTSEIPLAYEFYEDKFKQNIVQRINSKEFDNFQPTFESNEKTYSLFGSKLYYGQATQEAKALLFLHTIPFDGTSNSNDDVKSIFSPQNLKFFNERAGFVSVPESWILLFGGLLLKAENNMVTFGSDTGSLIPNYNNSLLPEAGDLLLYRYGVLGFDTFTSGPLNFNDNKTNRSYQNLSNVVTRLPNSVKQIFIDYFKDWVNGDWLNIKSNLEIFKTDTTLPQIDEYWDNFDNINTLSNIFNVNFRDNYDVLEKTDSRGNFNVKIKVLSLDNKESTQADEVMNSFLNEKKVIINGTYRIWEGSEESFTNFQIPIEQLNKYQKKFFEVFKNLNAETAIDPETQIKRTLFDSDNVDDIKLSLYKNVKSIYNKWVVGASPEVTGVVVDNLFNSFKFIDRSHSDISKKLKVSPTGFIDYLTSNSNINFYNFIARILRDNHFDFIPLPTFVDYSKPEDVKSIFEPIRFKDSINSDARPNFICMYFGEQSNKLNIDKKSKTNKNDSFAIESKYDKDGNLQIGDGSELPMDFTDSGTPVPYFLVSYADQNQSLFKKIKLNQNEFTETNESLEIIESISKMNRNNSIGQNLFDVYNNRAYSAEVEMLGCAQIQPFMFFQINNVPIFDGAYSIINTTHHIKPNHMTTSFKGVRIRKIKTKMVDVETLYAHLLANLNEVDNEDVTLADLDYVGKIGDRDVTTTIVTDFNIDKATNNQTIIGIIIEE